LFFHLLLLFLLTLIGSAFSLAILQQNDGRAAVNDPTLYPYHVAIFAKNIRVGNGAIINQSYVITVASIVANRSASDLLVFGGTNLSGPNGTLYGVVRVVVHEDFAQRDDELVNNIALLQVAPAFSFTETLKSISVLNRDVLTNAERVIVTSFGNDFFNSTVPEQLTETRASTYLPTVCLLATGVSHSGSFCLFSTDPTDFINVDEGSPVILEFEHTEPTETTTSTNPTETTTPTNPTEPTDPTVLEVSTEQTTLIGLASFKPQADRRIFIFTNVANYDFWIKDKLNP